MTGSGRNARRARRCPAAALLVLVLLAALAGCGPGGPGTRTEGTDAAAQSLLDRWAAAVRQRDEAAYLAAVDPAADGYRAERRRVFAGLGQVPLASWEYRLVRTGGFGPLPGDGHRVAAEAELRYRLDGYDTAPVTTSLRLTLVRRGDRWYVAGQAPASGGGQLWEQGAVTAVRGERSLVLGVDQDPDRLRALADLADRAVPAVDAAWRGGWAERVVVEMPASLERMAALLGAPASHYRGIAAVTTGVVGTGGASPASGATGEGTAPADRIIVNPEAYGALGDFGRRIVLTHETAHVATRSRTSAATPLWLSEGFADWAAYRTSGRTPRQAAPELAEAVAAGRAPQQLPEDADFGFAGEAGRLARAYEEGWLACRMIAEEWGEEKLVAFYRAVGSHRSRAGALDAALREVLGIGREDFTGRWRSYVAAGLGRPTG